MAVYSVTISKTSGSNTVNISGDSVPDVISLADGSTLASLSVSAGRGPKGDGFTGGSYNASTGVVTFTSNDGMGFSTGDLRGDLSEPGPIGDVTPNTGAFTNFSATGNAVIGGDLTVQGTTTTVDSTTVAIADKNIELAKDATTSAEADGGGITLVGAGATITYSSASDIWGLNKGLNVSGNVTLSGTVDGRDVASDGSKLDGIESGATADQTASEIKTAYESNADTNAFTDAEQSKLLGIESNATADQTAGEIKTAYESNADTNAFTDSEQSKLSGIEANADVTDTANVTAAGALMDSEVTNLAAVKAFDPADYVTETSATGSAVLPAGTDAQRDGTPSAGYIRFNTTSDSFEGYDGTAWGEIGGAGGGLYKGENGEVGSSAGDIFRVNEQTLNTDVTIDASENASAAGPLTVASGVTLTVASGGSLVIV